MNEDRAITALDAAGLDYRIVRHGPVPSLEEAAEARGATLSQILKTLVVRRGDDDYLFILVPGGREISWPKLRAHLGVARMSMPDAGTAYGVTGFVRGTITPFGSLRPLPAIVDTTVDGPVFIGAGAYNVSALIDADDLIRVLHATVADVTSPARGVR
ncbi:YbaK/EbsC family protein [Nocardioides deserti]|uniref:YbaK/EbsC family protein n=1 Tax=Nocardioides deserti TaxID=1588644 RepID=A0ABR6U509_9ACTN|nr:YbaK/EbsC family protein [Nocardioides deserti]